MYKCHMQICYNIFVDNFQYINIKYDKTISKYLLDIKCKGCEIIIHTIYYIIYYIKEIILSYCFTTPSILILIYKTRQKLLNGHRKLERYRVKKNHQT